MKKIQHLADLLGFDTQVVDFLILIKSPSMNTGGRLGTFLSNCEDIGCTIEYVKRKKGHPLPPYKIIYKVLVNTNT